MDFVGKATLFWRNQDRDQLAPLSLHDVLQVTVLPFMQALHTSTH